MSLLSFFIKPAEPEEEVSAPKSAPSEDSRIASTASRIQQNIVNVLPSTGVAAVDQKFLDHFSDVMEKADLPGPDFFEFMQALDNMEKVGLPEDKAYQAAWASFVALARSSDTNVLNNTAQQYIAALQKDKQEFTTQVDKAMREDVGGMKKKIDDLMQENKSSAEQIIKLQETIEKNNANIARLNGEITEKTVKITNGNNSYNATFDAFLKRINDTLNKINIYIGGAK